MTKIDLHPFCSTDPRFPYLGSRVIGKDRAIALLVERKVSHAVALVELWQSGPLRHAAA